MSKLMVSYNCGCSYGCEFEHENLDKVVAESITRQLDKKGLRWVIEDENGNIVEASQIHKEIIGFMEKINSKESKSR